MAYTKTVTAASAVSGTFTLTLSNVDDLYVGDTVYISGTSNDGWSGQHTLTAVNTTALTVQYTHGNTTGSLSNVNGQLIVRPQWVASADVESFLGIDVATANDTAYIETCVLASNEWCFNKRREAGYTDRAALVPNSSVFQGAVLYSATLYRERGSVDSFASFDAMSINATPSATLGRIMQLLGCGKAQVA